MRFTLKSLATAVILSVFATVLYNTATNFYGGAYWVTAPFFMTVIVGFVWPALLLAATFALLFYLWRYK